MGSGAYSGNFDEDTQQRLKGITLARLPNHKRAESTAGNNEDGAGAGKEEAARQ